MTAPFSTIRDAALAVLTSGADLNRRDGQFLGGIAFQDFPLSAKQEAWLQGLLKRSDLPPLEGGAQ
jgi:hypothetical protein